MVNDTEKQFSPTGWCTEMASSNFTGIAVVYSNDILDRMNGCEFHYNQSVQRQMRSLDEPHRTTFNSFAKDLLRSTIPEAFKKAHGDFKLFLSSNNETNDLIGWLVGWLVVHAGWKSSNEIHLRLLNCAYVDIKTSLLLNQLFEDVHSGDYDGDIIDNEVYMYMIPTMVSKTHALTVEAGCEC